MKTILYAALLGLLAFIANAAEESTPSFSELITKGREAFAQQRWDEALVASEAATKIDATRFESFALAAMALKEKGKFGEALAMIEKALRLAPVEKKALLTEIKKEIPQETPKEPESPTPPPLPTKEQSAPPPTSASTPKTPIGTLLSDFKTLPSGVKYYVWNEGSGYPPNTNSMLIVRSEFFAVSNNAVAPYPSTVKSPQYSTDIRTIRGWQAEPLQRMRAGSMWLLWVPTNITRARVDMLIGLHLLKIETPAP
jgi:FKBP-type peptidyl-prolyl cis-trans isomerase